MGGNADRSSITASAAAEVEVQLEEVGASDSNIFSNADLSITVEDSVGVHLSRSFSRGSLVMSRVSHCLRGGGTNYITTYY